MARGKEIHEVQVTSPKARSFVIDHNYFVLAGAVVVFIFCSFQLDVTQDDAFISFRYAENYLSGHGLVYNIGERVEGYTNFLWVILLALFKGVFGAEYITISRFIGITSGEVIFFLLYLLLRHHFGKVPVALYFSLTGLVLSNLSLAYWSIASLETSAFACIALAAIVAEYQRSHLTPALLVIATLLRPEGVIVFSVIFIYRCITEHTMPWYHLVMYTVPLIPFAVFKLTYYGNLLPNPYYAKSGMGVEYIQSGLEYFWFFTQTIGVYGIIFFIPLLALRRLWKKYALLYLYILIYSGYIIWVGGDVLKVYRFFIPVVPILYFLFVVSLEELLKRIRFTGQYVHRLALICVAFFSAASISFSYEYIQISRKAELDLMGNMHFMGSMVKKYMGPDFSLAASTIGMVGYQLMGHRVIDMLGLTDPSIAHHPESVEGLSPTWKERRFNISYLLKQQPDFILFSTGVKPSAPAERALLLHSEFRRAYSTLGFRRAEPFEVIWKRKGQINMTKDVVHSDIKFVDKIIDGIYDFHRTIHGEALTDFREARQRLGEDFTMLSVFIGDCYLKMNNIDSALVYLKEALTIDTLCWEAHLDMIDIAQKTQDTATLRYHYDFLVRQSPWVFDDSYQLPGDIQVNELF